MPFVELDALMSHDNTKTSSFQGRSCSEWSVRCDASISSASVRSSLSLLIAEDLEKTNPSDDIIGNNFEGKDIKNLPQLTAETEALKKAFNSGVQMRKEMARSWRLERMDPDDSTQAYRKNVVLSSVEDMIRRTKKTTASSCFPTNRFFSFKIASKS